MKSKNFRCVFVGKVSENKYNYYQEILDYIAEHKLQNKVMVSGESFQDMPALYSVADIVLAIKEEPEAFGRTVVEAQAMGKIVIATNVGGPGEVIQDRKTGFLVPTHDPSTLADTVDHALNLSAEEHKKITTAAKKLVAEKYSIKEMCKRTMEVYLELLEEREKIYG